ncbi:hypothetical protein GLAREA_05097 [Glarea lozoyensis ATCC 20868]|uniref:ARM repeat-containing protein n=1 Tax=Glarea lozoyensis (strain ATCC 20868 / MF5171) TaxID=1116229 RepID=S3DF82_GLAL2|nr:uncharacterized protein GLAREA_05097 [Glarea lozoyensis ATCC 20868]EPE35759.1 hypothetical protein GLAREA_05097 [Glarea lozoyensis ATCC 20868]
MFNPARKAIKTITSHKNNNDSDRTTLPPQTLPKQFSLAQLRDEVTSSDRNKNKTDEFQNLLILNSCLTNRERLDRDSSDDNEAAIDLLVWTSRAILPDGSIIPQDDAPEEISKEAREKALTLIRQKANHGLKILQQLITKIYPSAPKSLPESVLLSLIAYTNPSPHTPWTSPSCSEIATTILSKYTHQTHTQEFFSVYLLQKVIRPFFSTSAPETVTSTGRKAIPSSAPQKKTGTEEFERSRKPWKYDATTLISQTWYQFTPPLLTLLDDPSTPIRIQGAELLSLFLPHISSTLLQQSGLGSLFEDALMPTLMYLPNLTPLEESLQLLPAAYEALLVLCDARFPQHSNNESKGKSTALTAPNEKERSKFREIETSRLKFLDRIARKGIFAGFAHSREHPEIVQLLMNYLTILIDKMGLNTVKHLKDIIPLLASPLTDPFATARPGLLLAALGCLQGVILNAWVRIVGEGAYRIEVLRVLVVGWRNLVMAGGKGVGEEKGDGKEGKGGLGDVRREMKVAARMMVSAGARGDVEMLVRGVEGEGLDELFGIGV